MSPRIILSFGLTFLGLIFALIGQLLFAIFDKLEDWCYALDDKLNNQ